MERSRRVVMMFVFVGAANVSLLPAQQNPLSNWVRVNKPDYRVRTTPNSFHLIGYVFADDKLTPPPLDRGGNCLNEILMKKIAEKDPDVVASAEDKVFNGEVKTSDLGVFLQLTGKQLDPVAKADLDAGFKRHRVKSIQLQTGHVSEYIITSSDLEGMSKSCADRMKRDKNSVAVAQALGIDGAKYVLVDERGTEISVDAELGSQLAKFGLGSSGQKTQTAEYKEPIFFGYVPAKYCSKNGDYKNTKKKC